MKRYISYVLLAVLIFSMIPLNSFAAEQSGDHSEVIYFEDGSYMIITTQTAGSRASGTISGSKHADYYASDGTMDWKAVLSGTFTYNGTSATCTASSISVTIYNSAWYVISKSASKSGASAIGSVTMGKKLLGVTVAQVTKDLSLTCDKNGNLS